MKRSLIALGLCLLLAWGVWRQPSSDAELVTHREFFALGTLVQVSFAQPVTAELISAVQNELQAFEVIWSVHGDGPLAQLNAQLARSNSAALPDILRAGFETAQRACKTSGGLFDPGIGGLVKLWGFDDEDHFRSTPPDAADIASANAARAHLCDAKLGAQISLLALGAHFDFGASAKGRAVDTIIASLQAQGIQNAIVNAGGDLKAIGKRPDRAWRIGIRHPRPKADTPSDMLASLSVLDGEAVFSSGDYERYFIVDGRRYHHIIDPRDAYPAQGSQSSTVVHSSAEWADAGATALFVAGPENAAAVMQAMGINLWMLVDSSGQVHISDALKPRLDFAP